MVAERGYSNDRIEFIRIIFVLLYLREPILCTFVLMQQALSFLILISFKTL